MKYLKDLTKEELDEAPAEIQYLYICNAILKTGTGGDIIDESLKKYPQYFIDAP
jgi:hypothetical protein